MTKKPTISLEQRLRELLRTFEAEAGHLAEREEMLAYLTKAAVIGAEIEREECAQDMQHHPAIDGNTADRLADYLRHRGDER